MGVFPFHYAFMPTSIVWLHAYLRGALDHLAEVLVRGHLGRKVDFQVVQQEVQDLQPFNSGALVLHQRSQIKLSRKSAKGIELAA